MGIAMSGALVNKIGRHFGNLREAKRVLPKQEESARMVSDLSFSLPTVRLLHSSRIILGGSCPSKPTRHRSQFDESYCYCTDIPYRLNRGLC